MNIMNALSREIYDFFGPKMGEDEELRVYACNTNMLSVEFSVAWYDFLLRLHVRFDGYGLWVHLYDEDRVSYRQDIGHPGAIDGLLAAISNEWDKYLCRDTSKSTTVDR